MEISQARFISTNSAIFEREPSFHTHPPPIVPETVLCNDHDQRKPGPDFESNWSRLPSSCILSWTASSMAVREKLNALS